jgi:hypothetical protein
MKLNNLEILDELNEAEAVYLIEFLDKKSNEIESEVLEKGYIQWILYGNSKLGIRKMILTATKTEILVEVEK